MSSTFGSDNDLIILHSAPMSPINKRARYVDNCFSAWISNIWSEVILTLTYFIFNDLSNFIIYVFLQIYQNHQEHTQSLQHIYLFTQYYLRFFLFLFMYFYSCINLCWQCFVFIYPLFFIRNNIGFSRDIWYFGWSFHLSRFLN